MTATSFHGDIRAGLRQRLALLSGLPAVDYEGRPYTPTVGTPWLSEQFMPVQSVVSATGLGGTMPPAIFGARHFPALTALGGDRGGASHLAGAPVIALDPALALDVDTPEDLARAEAWLAV